LYLKGPTSKGGKKEGIGERREGKKSGGEVGREKEGIEGKREPQRLIYTPHIRNTEIPELHYIIACKQKHFQYNAYTC